MTLMPFPQLVLYIGMTLNIFTVMSVLSIFFFRNARAGTNLSGQLCLPRIPGSFRAGRNLDGLPGRHSQALDRPCDVPAMLATGGVSPSPTHTAASATNTRGGNLLEEAKILSRSPYVGHPCSYQFQEFLLKVSLSELVAVISKER